MIHAIQLVQHELIDQRNKWGLEHDLENHGSQGLIEAAFIIASPFVPDTAGYEGDEWFFQLWRVHENNHPKRLAIAAAMLQSAIECTVYEKGKEKMKDE